MSKTIWKFPLDPRVDDEITVPGIITKICHVAADYSEAVKYDLGLLTRTEKVKAERVTVWVEFDKTPNMPRPGAPVPLAIVGTGHGVPEKLDHVGTAVMPSGLVWHLYMNTDYMRLCCGGGPQYGHAWSCPKCPD